MPVMWESTATSFGVVLVGQAARPATGTAGDLSARLGQARLSSAGHPPRTRPPADQQMEPQTPAWMRAGVVPALSCRLLGAVKASFMCYLYMREVTRGVNNGRDSKL